MRGPGPGQRVEMAPLVGCSDVSISLCRRHRRLSRETKWTQKARVSRPQELHMGWELSQSLVGVGVMMVRRGSDTHLFQKVLLRAFVVVL